MSPLLSSLGSASAKSLGRALRPFIRKPSITSPANNATGQSRTSLSFTSSAAQIVGKGTPHASSDWQIASNSNFATIVASTTSDTTNKTSWVASGLNLSFNTTYYARVRYKDSTNLVSDYSDTITFITTQYLPALTNGSSTFNFGTASTFTVPANIGRLKVYMSTSSSNRGGKLEVTFDVTPGEQFVVTSSKNMLGPKTSYDSGGSTFTQATLWAVLGQGGNQFGAYDGYPQVLGGTGGGDNGAGSPNGTAGGGSQSAGGYGATSSAFNIGNDGGINGTPGGALTGGNGAIRYGGDENDPYSYAGGPGGVGWYGGGGGGASRYGGYGQLQDGGGGGSSRIQVPSPRNPTTTINSNGSGDWPSGSGGGYWIY